MAPSASSPVVAPALPHSSVTEERDLVLVLPLITGAKNEGRATKIWGRAWRGLRESTYPFFPHSVHAGLVPPFYKIFYAILSQY